MRIVVGDGREFNGTALQIVQAMQSWSFADSSTVSQYIDESVKFVDSLGHKMNVTGDTENQKAESFVSEMIRCGLAKEI